MDRRAFLRTAALAGATAATGPSALSRAAPSRARVSPPGDPLHCPIDTIVVLMMENRSFDHYLGTMPGVDGLRRGMSNPDVDGKSRVPIFDLDRDVIADPDPNHSWKGGRRQLNGGRMDGFVVTTGSHEPMGYYTAATIPWLRAFASEFVTADRWFCSHLGNTQPNRNYFHSAQDFGSTSNDGSPYPADKSLYARLDAAGIQWKYYFIDLPFLATYDRFGQWLEQGKIGTAADYFAEALTGRLPQVAVVDPGFYINDDHPPADIQLGQRYMADVFDALKLGPHWHTSAFFLTYDEWGGFYDHVVPPKFPDLRPSADIQKDHRQAGFRVPTVIAGPWAKRHTVDSTTYEHSSITKFIEWRFGLKPLTPRDAAAANPAASMFDFRRPDFSLPHLPIPEFDPVALATSLTGLALLPDPVPALAEVADAVVPPELDGRPRLGRRLLVPTIDRLHREPAVLGA